LSRPHEDIRDTLICTTAVHALASYADTLYEEDCMTNPKSIGIVGYSCSGVHVTGQNEGHAFMVSVAF